MTPFRYVATDLVTGQVIAALPLHDVTYTTLLNGAGPMSASLRLPDDDPVLADLYVAATEETKRALYIEFDGTVVWAGPIWTTDYNTDTQTLSLNGAEMWSYWRRRRIRFDAEYTQRDQFRIARSLLRKATLPDGGDINVGLPIAHCGVLRDAVYREFEDKNLAEAIENLAEVDDGFDFWVDVERVDDTYVRTFRCAYPQRGRPVEESGLYFTLGNNMLNLQLPRNGANSANSILGIGAGEGIDMLTHTATDTNAIALGYPLLEGSRSLKDVALLTTLIDHTAAELTARKRPVSLPKATVLIDDVPRLGTYDPGDEALLQVLPGSEPRWLTGVALPARLNGITVRTPDDGGPATAQLTFEELAE